MRHIIASNLVFFEATVQPSPKTHKELWLKKRTGLQANMRSPLMASAIRRKYKDIMLGRIETCFVFVRGFKSSSLRTKVEKVAEQNAYKKFKFQGLSPRVGGRGSAGGVAKRQRGGRRGWLHGWLELLARLAFGPPVRVQADKELGN
jgi:hypothetical protein